jgi:hypothetical protein
VRRAKLRLRLRLRLPLLRMLLRDICSEVVDID